MRRSSQLLSLVVLFVLIAAFGTTAVFADVTGSIQGIVTDRSQGIIAGVKITVTNVDTNLSQETTSAADGSYHFLALPAGNYKITASASGFRPYSTTDIVLQVNDQLKLD